MQPGPYKEVFLNIYFLKHKVSINSRRRLWGHDLPLSVLHKGHRGFHSMNEVAFQSFSSGINFETSAME